MRVVCDNCGAVYKVPDEKLSKPVNKATCRNCSHRMLIPRPQGAADRFEEEDRTLIRKMPFGGGTPAGGRARITRPIDLDEPEHTLPHGTSGGARPRGEARPLQQPFTGDRGTAREPSAEYTQWVQNSPASGLSVDPMLSPMDSDGDAATVVSPRPNSLKPAPPRVASETLQATPHIHGDLLWVLAATIASFVGFVLLAVVSDRLGLAGIGVRTLGLFLSAAGSITAVFLLLTGRLGRFPARRWLSLAAAVPFGALIAALLGFAHVWASWDTFRPASNTDPSLSGSLEPMVEMLPPEPATPEPATPEPATPEPATPAPATPAPAPARPAPSARPSPRPAPPPARITPTPRPAPTVSVRPSPAPVSRPAPAPAPVTRPSPAPVTRPAPAARPSPAPSTSTSVPMEVLDLLLRNNLDVKRCFFSYMQANGQLPSRVDVRFTLQPTGRATGIGVTQAQYANSDLDTCLGGAIAGIEFPPSSGSASRITYPFIFQ